MSDDSSEISLDSEPESDEPDALIGTVIADRYRVDERLGVGGMGAVYRAEHVLMKKPVAVKVLHREMTVLGEVVKRFEREAVAAGRIEHPNVTVATDFGKLPDGSFYLVLEYVPGRSLTRAMKEDGAMPEERALLIARQVAAGLGAAHAAGIVHRDLKPDNIMLIERGGTKDFVKVLDFGIAKVATTDDGTGSSQLTRVGAVFGTPQYMAPEQAAGKPVDHRADLYALGLVLYEMLAGKPAFASTEIVALLTKQLIEPPPPLPSSVGPEASSITMRLLEKEPDARFQSSAEVIASIDAFLGPTALPPDSTVLGVASLRGAMPPPSSGAQSPRPPLSSARTVGMGEAVAPATLTTAMDRKAWLLDRLDDVRRPTLRLVERVRDGDVVHVAGRDVQIRILVAAGAALLLVAGFLAFRGEKTVTVTSSSGSAQPAEEKSREVSPLVARAMEGDPVAVAKLEAEVEKDPDAISYAAIGRGRVKLGDFVRGVEALKKAVKEDSDLAQDHDILAAVRRAADNEGTQKDVMEFAATSLGEGGVDVLFDIWASTTERTQTTVLAKGYLDRDEVRGRASRALKIALDLRKGGLRCEEAKRLVNTAKEIGDERAFRPLNQLNARKGCGFLSLSDCYPCLRGDDTLGEALKATQGRKGPRY